MGNKRVLKQLIRKEWKFIGKNIRYKEFQQIWSDGHIDIKYSVDYRLRKYLFFGRWIWIHATTNQNLNHAFFLAKKLRKRWVY